MSHRSGPKLSDDFKIGNSRPSSAYDRYKASLHAIFDGKAPLPKHLQEGFSEPSEIVSEAKMPEAKEPITPTKKRRLQQSTKSILGSLLAKIRDSSSKTEITAAIDALQASGFELPNEELFLSKALNHSSPNIQEGALLCLDGLADTHKIVNFRLLKQRLDNLELTTSDRRISSLCGALKVKLG